MAMKLNTGKVEFPIEFDNGDKQSIYFNPNDPNLFVRLKNFENKLKDRAKELEDIELGADGQPKNPQDIKMLESFEKAQGVIFEEIDIAFGGEISAVVFKHCSPFAIVNGEYFIMQFVEAIKPEIEGHIKKANSDIEKKMQKHIAKYQK